MSEHLTKKVICISVLLLLAGCEGPPEQNKYGGVQVYGAGGAATATSITMPDGTRCVALVGYYKAGLSCEWSDKNVE